MGSGCACGRGVCVWKGDVGEDASKPEEAKGKVEEVGGAAEALEAKPEEHVSEQA